VLKRAQRFFHLGLRLEGNFCCMAEEETKTKWSRLFASNSVFFLFYDFFICLARNKLISLQFFTLNSRANILEPIFTRSASEQTVFGTKASLVLIVSSTRFSFISSSTASRYKLCKHLNLSNDATASFNDSMIYSRSFEFILKGKSYLNSGELN